MNTPFEPKVRMQVLDDADIAQIHEAAVEILERVGLQIHSEEGRKILLDAGGKALGGDVISIDIKSGKERWRFTTQGKVASSPFISEGVLYVGSTDHKIYALPE